MFSFAAEKVVFARIGLILFLLQLSNFALGLPPFQAGIWMQTEPVMMGTMLAALMTGLWLAFGLTKRWLVMESWHPLWLVLAASVVWQLLVTAGAATPWHSWFGPAPTGEGTLWHIMLLLMVMLVHPLWQVLPYRRLLLAAAVANLLVQCLLYWMTPPDANFTFNPANWTPVSWAAYLSFQAGYLWLALASHRPFTKPSVCLLAAGLMLVVLLTSHNRTAMVLLTIAMAISIAALAAGAAPRLRRMLSPAKWRYAMLAGCLLPMGWILFCAEVPSLHIRPDSPWSTITDKNGNIGSRVVLMQVALSALQHEPWRWLVGGGWGRFNDDTFKYILVDGVDAYQDGQHRPNCTIVDGGAFHSHSQPLEALLSLGLPGLLLWLAVPMLLLIRLPGPYFWQTAPMLTAMTMLGYFWFQILECLPYEAMALVSLATLIKGRARGPAKTVPLGVVLLLCTSMAILWSIRQYSVAMLYDLRLKSTLHDAMYQDDSAIWMDEDFKRGGERFRVIAPRFALHISDKAANGMLGNSDVLWFDLYLQTAHGFAQSPHAGADVSFTDLWLLSFAEEAFKDNSLFNDIRQKADAALEGSVLQLLRKAPLRDDLDAPFLQGLDAYTHHDVSRQIDILQRMLAIAPDHRGALWTLGHLLLSREGRKEEGMAMVRRAVSLGVQRVFPVKSQELRQWQNGG